MLFLYSSLVSAVPRLNPAFQLKGLPQLGVPRSSDLLTFTGLNRKPRTPSIVAHAFGDGKKARKPILLNVLGDSRAEEKKAYASLIILLLDVEKEEAERLVDTKEFQDKIEGWKTSFGPAKLENIESIDWVSYQQFSNGIPDDDFIERKEICVQIIDAVQELGQKLQNVADAAKKCVELIRLLPEDIKKFFRRYKDLENSNRVHQADPALLKYIKGDCEQLLDECRSK
eukprot:NODE_253_length_12805_cov_0.273413.p4 type:complete len:228 gc:universal NODE_253_length_12805_cov_0.273413:1579-2262(+)